MKITWIGKSNGVRRSPPPYREDAIASLNGPNGQVRTLSANKIDGKIKLEPVLREPPGLPAREDVGGMGLVGFWFDPPPGQTITIEVRMLNRLRRQHSVSVRRAEVISMGYSGLFVIEFDENNAPVGMPIFEVAQLWNVLTYAGTGRIRYDRNDVLVGQAPLTFGHTYFAWAWVGVLGDIKKNRPDQPGAPISTVAADLETTVNSFSSTVS